MTANHTCDGCGHFFASGDEVAAEITYNYAGFAITDYYCVECRYEITRAVNRLHRRERKVNHG